jgi:hypothetical protein
MKQSYLTLRKKPDAQRLEVLDALEDYLSNLYQNFQEKETLAHYEQLRTQLTITLQAVEAAHKKSGMIARFFGTVFTESTLARFLKDLDQKIECQISKLKKTIYENSINLH